MAPVRAPRWPALRCSRTPSATSTVPDTAVAVARRESQARHPRRVPASFDRKAFAACSRQTQSHLRSVADLALDGDRAGMLLDYDRSCDGQPLAGALPDLFGREEGVENAIEVLLRNPTTVVLDDDFDAFLDSARADLDQSGTRITAGRLDGVRRVD